MWSRERSVTYLSTVNGLGSTADTGTDPMQPVDPNPPDRQDRRATLQQAVDLWIEFGADEAARLLGVKPRDVMRRVVAASERVDDG